MAQQERMFDGAERAVRFAHRMDRRCSGHTVFGLILIALGAIFLLDNLDVLNARVILRYWPVLLVLWGGQQLLFGRGGQRMVGAAMAAGGGVLLGNRFLGWRVDVWDFFWPAILMLVGFSVLTHSFGRHRRRRTAAPESHVLPGSGMTDATTPAADDQTEVSSTFREMAILGGIERRNISQTFRGGDATAVLGGVELDLRECRMAGSEAAIDVFAMLGGVVLRIPKDWTVDSHVTAVLGGVDDQSDPPLESGARRLVVRGTAFLGGIEIKN